VFRHLKRPTARREFFSCTGYISFTGFAAHLLIQFSPDVRKMIDTPHHASFTDVLSIGGKKERFAFTRKARKCLISSIRCSFLPKALAISRGAIALSERQLLLTRTTTRNLVIDTRDVKEERTESWFIKQSMTIEILP
jgi:hypothetical protein